MPQNLSRRGALARALAASAPLLGTWRPARGADPLVVGFVYVSPVGEAGWTFQHDLGRRELERALGPRVRTVVVESVAEGPDSERVMRDLARQGARLIFATSFGYLEPALRVAADFPGVRFQHAGGYKTAPNVATYDARYYEARWLAGHVAGWKSRSGVAGYVAGFPVPEVVQGINAFALGMRAVNPRAEVRVIWLDAWFDPPRERDAAQALIDAGADVLTHHSGSPAVAQAAQSSHRTRGVGVVPYPSDMRMFAPDAQIAAIVHRWGAFYTRVVTSVLEGRWKPEPVWGGLASGMVDVVALDATLASGQRATFDEKRRALVAGRIAPFAGRIVDNAGTVRQASGTMPDAAIRTMDWFVEGVVGRVGRR